MERDITNAALTPGITPDIETIEQLRKALKDGPAIISVDTGCGGHVAVIDYMDDTTARIREPYHGWEITITIEALEKSWQPGSIIQVLAV